MLGRFGCMKPCLWSDLDGAVADGINGVKL